MSNKRIVSAIEGQLGLTVVAGRGLDPDGSEVFQLGNGQDVSVECHHEMRMMVVRFDDGNKKILFY